MSSTMYYKKLIKLLAICLIFWTFVAIFQQITYARKHIIINQTTATIQGQVWLDENEDGIRDVGETTLENIMVKLYDLESRTQRTTVTNDNGLFMFSSLPTDDYQIEFIAPIGYAFTALDRGEDDTIDSDVDPVLVWLFSGRRALSSKHRASGSGVVQRPTGQMLLKLLVVLFRVSLKLRRQKGRLINIYLKMRVS